MEDYDCLMKGYIDHLSEFHCYLEECNKEQQSICNEVLESINAVNQRTLVSFRISDGSCSAVDVRQLLFEDIFELSRHLQSGVEEHVKSYKEFLERTNEDHLYNLQTKISVLQHSSKDAKERALNWKMEPQEIKDLRKYLSLTTHVIHGIKECRFLGNSCLKQMHKKMKEHRGMLNVDIYKQYVTNYYRTIEACNTEQRLFSNEIIEALKAIHEEKLLAFHISVGSNDAVNVQQLLFEDVFEFSRHLQPGVEEHVKSYRERLQEANEDQLYHLLRRVSMLPPSSMNSKEVALIWKMEEQEMKDLTEYLSLTTSIIRGLTACRTQGNSCLKKLQEKLKEHREMLTYQEELRTVNEINKRNLGMMIIRQVGHEGSEDKYGLRRLLQTCIDFLPTRTVDVWRNASITIYDEDDNMYKIGSGEMEHQFICQMNNGEPFINDRMSVSSGSTYMHRAETTDDPSKQRYMEKCQVS